MSYIVIDLSGRLFTLPDIADHGGIGDIDECEENPMHGLTSVHAEGAGGIVPDTVVEPAFDSKLSLRSFGHSPSTISSLL